MGPLKTIGLCALLILGAQTGQNCGLVRAFSSSPIDRWQSEISEASRRFDIPEDWIRAVMKQESGGRLTLDGLPITSRAGAMGLMQLMPETWLDMRDQFGLGRNPYDPHDNILAGTGYLRQMFDRYAYPNVFAAYHAGPGRLNAFLSGEKPLPDATLAYVKAIVPDAEIHLSSTEKPTPNGAKAKSNSLFFMSAESKDLLSNGSENRRQQAGDPTRGESSLFIPLSATAR